MKHTFVALALSIATVTCYHFLVAVPSSVSMPNELELKELSIVDDAGIVRVRIGSDLPDAVIDGEVLQRGGEAAGIILYDVNGLERSGYVTMMPGNNVMLTLDNERKQAALFAAGPESGSSLKIWHAGNALDLRVDSGGARYTAIRDGQVLFQQPPTDLPIEACLAYQGAVEQSPGTNVLAICMERFTAAKCAECLENAD